MANKSFSGLNIHVQISAWISNDPKSSDLGLGGWAKNEQISISFLYNLIIPSVVDASKSWFFTLKQVTDPFSVSNYSIS